MPMKTFSPLLLSLYLACLPAGAKSIVCWTDDKGQRACGDRVPPEYARKERQVLNERGMVVDTKPREKTPEEIADAERKAQQEREAKRAAEAQAAYDRFLRQTYTSVADIEQARDSRLAALDARLQLAEKALSDSEAALTDLRARSEEDAEDADKLARQIRTFEASRDSNGNAVASLRKEREELVASYRRDIARYRELTGGAPAPQP
jgi:chromosome segregation ATPase